eukprot:CAMPEP_0195298606 /NCGR_PEP_ID=MMETSP0707-20130614/23867_1 /TAXON_ID=33640 /ORGANISM="Asterionellopsis glacialis, Strain CCMP134" /LENGTH=820 /DNA_ID=CAMNT_0040360781 /DNA_START=36 /DNA_END=2498 /DNA_ORIENTATION=+
MSSSSSSPSSRSLLQSSLVVVSCLSMLSSSDAIENPLQLDQGNARHQAKPSRMVWKDNDHGSAYMPEMLTTADYRAETPKRKLQGYGATGFNNFDFRPLRIHFITEPLLQTKTGDNSFRDQNIDHIVNDVLPEIADTWSSHLSVDAPDMYLSVANSVCFGFFDHALPQTTPADSPADLLIVVGGEDTLYTSSGLTNPVCGNGVLSTAKACNVDQNERPVIGFINFCVEDRVTYSQRDLEDYTANAVQETAHILGFDPTLMLYFRDAVTREPLTPRNSRGIPEKRMLTCSDNSQEYGHFPGEKILQTSTSSTGLVHHHIVTPKVAQVAKNHLNCQQLPGAQLENQPLIGTCTGHHWDERLFSSEIMSSSFDGASGSVLSPLTLALLEDSGWYKVSYHGAQMSPVGHGLGCDFAKLPCIVNDSVPDYGKGVFCSTPVELDGHGLVAENNPMYCDASHTKIALCDLWHADDQKASANLMGLNYFTNDQLVSLHIQADFCPMPRISTGVDCTDPKGKSGTSVTVYPGEVFGSGSRCVNAKNNEGLSRPACMKVECSDGLRKVVVGDQVCQYDGQIINFTNGGSFECPRLTTMCPQFFCPSGCCGQGTCNFETGQCSVACQDGLGYGALPIETPNPSAKPTSSPRPTPSPTKRPTNTPTSSPTSSPTEAPKISFVLNTIAPTATVETPSPTRRPTMSPTKSPTKPPTKSPTNLPTTAVPTGSPTVRPTESKQEQTPVTRPDTEAPQMRPSPEPTLSPTNPPETNSPTVSPTLSSNSSDSSDDEQIGQTGKTLAGANAEQISGSPSILSFGFTTVLVLAGVAGMTL